MRSDPRRCSLPVGRRRRAARADPGLVRRDRRSRREQPIDGVYHGDIRFSAGGDAHAATAGSPRVDLVVERRRLARRCSAALLRALDDRVARSEGASAARARRRRRAVGETLTIVSRVASRSRRLRLRLVPDFAPMQEVKAGAADGRAWTATAAAGGRSRRVDVGRASFTVSAPRARRIATTDEGVTIDVADHVLDPRRVRERVVLDRLTTRRSSSRACDCAGGETCRASSGDPRLRRWLDAALGDLDALRLTLPDHPEDEFFAAGAPWFFTLFGRDSLWAARLALPVDVGIAASTLRVLARLQGSQVTRRPPSSRARSCTSCAARRSSCPARASCCRRSITAPSTRPRCGCACWRTPGEPGCRRTRCAHCCRRCGARWSGCDHGDSAGDGFLDYVDETGHGLANQGWKDSGDSIQWRDGSARRGPDRAVRGAGVRLRGGDRAAPACSTRSARTAATRCASGPPALQARFAERTGSTTPEGRYPAIALDADSARSTP